MKNRSRVYLLFLVFAVLTVYYPLLFAEANSVDDLKLLEWLLNADEFHLRSILFPGGGGYYRPLLVLTFVFDKYVWGLQESFMHLENVLLHTFNAALVFLITRRLLRQTGCSGDDRWAGAAPLVAGLLFGLHPINTEAVDWISGRTDVLACSCLLVSLFCLVSYLDSHRTLWLLPGATAFFLACLAKDPAVFFAPGALLLLHSYGRGELGGRGDTGRAAVFPGYLTFALVPVGYFWLRNVGLSGMDRGVATMSTAILGSEFGWALKLKLVLKAFGFYMKKLFIPWPLNFAIYSVSNFYIVMGILAIICCVHLLLRRKIYGALILTGAFIILPALLLPIRPLTWTPLAERYLYMPCAFCAIAVPVVACKSALFGRYRPSVTLSVFLLLCGLVLSTVQRNFVWQRNLTLFADTLKKSPDSGAVRNEYALAMQKEGRREEAKQLFLSCGTADVGKFNAVNALNKALALTADKKFDEARRVVTLYTDKNSPVYVNCLEMLVRISEKELDAGPTKTRRKELVSDLVGTLKKLQERTGEAYYYYRIGQRYLFEEEDAEAKKYFDLAYQNSPESAFYRPAAKKLAEKLGP